MIQQATPFSYKTSVHPSPLTIVKGSKEYTQQLQTLTNIAWQIAYTALWNGEEFSASEKEKAQAFITVFIKEQSNPIKAYSAFVQRVLLARQYINSHPGTYAPIPSLWLCPTNKNGFAGTQRWYQAVETARAALPNYKQPLKAFAEAILETVQTQQAKDFHYWRSYFSEQDAQQCLNLFLSTIANCQYAHSREKA
jgi:hypothetical protein